MTRFALLAIPLIGLVEPPAHADTVYDGKLQELACDIDMRFDGAIATGEIRQRFHNGGTEDAGASYVFELPHEAAIVAYATKGASGNTIAAMPVTAIAGTEKMTSRDVLDADPAFVTKVAGDTYRAVLQPIEPGRDLTTTTKFVVAADIVDGSLRVTLPARSAEDKLLAPCHVTVKATPGPGATAAPKTPQFTFDTKPAVVEVTLNFARPEPLVWTQTDVIDPKHSATLVTVLAPPARATTQNAHRALFVIDVSKSMDLVGRRNIARVMRAIATSLPTNSQLEAIIYDRTATRVLSGWKAATPANVDVIDKAIVLAPSRNGTDLDAAFTLAHTAIAEGNNEQTLVIAITDGMLGELDRDLAVALDAKSATVDMHVIALDPAGTTLANSSRLRKPIDQLGGSFIELSVDDLDATIGNAANWLRPSWTDVTLTGGSLDLPPQLVAGSGQIRTLMHGGALPAISLGAKATLAVVRVAAKPTPGAGAAAIAVSALDAIPEDLAKVRFVSAKTAFAVLADRGRVAPNRTAMVRGGGPYTRVVVTPDADPSRDVPVSARAAIATGVRPSAIAPIALERMLREQLQPHAFACYQRALGLDAKLAGTINFEMHIARGEVTRAVANGPGDATFRACLADAAYDMTAPQPNPRTQDDDETIVRYPLAFKLAENKPLVIPGDADSSTPIDVDAVERDTAKRTPVKVETNTPLGHMKPPKS